MKWILISLSFIFWSCATKNNYDVEKTEMVNIHSLTIPAVSAVSEPVRINVSAEANNGCWHDFKFKLEKKEDFKYAITSYASFESKGVCAAVIVTGDTTITFVPDKKGQYIFEANQSPFSVVTDTLAVN